MAIRYVQTLGAVAGYDVTSSNMVVNMVVITCEKPAEFRLPRCFPVREQVIRTRKNEGLVLTVRPTVRPRE